MYYITSSPRSFHINPPHTIHSTVGCVLIYFAHRVQFLLANTSRTPSSAYGSILYTHSFYLPCWDFAWLEPVQACELHVPKYSFYSLSIKSTSCENELI